MVPAAGLWLTTEPVGTVTLCAPPIVPTANAADCKRADADDSARPVTSGTVTRRGPRETVRSTVEPSGTDAPGPGICATTDPAGAAALWAVLTDPTARLAPARTAAASLCGRPTTSGTTTVGGPAETVKPTPDPGGRDVPAATLWSITCPAGTAASAAVAITPGTRPAARSAATASTWVSPIN